MCLTWEASSWSGAVEASTVLSVNTDLPQTRLLGVSSTCLIKILSCAGASLSTMLMNWQEDRVVLIKYWPSKYVVPSKWVLIMSMIMIMSLPSGSSTLYNKTILIMRKYHLQHHQQSTSSPITSTEGFPWPSVAASSRSCDWQRSSLLQVGLKNIAGWNKF